MCSSTPCPRGPCSGVFLRTCRWWRQMAVRVGLAASSEIRIVVRLDDGIREIGIGNGNGSGIGQGN